MANFQNQKDPIHSVKLNAGTKRTYFFDVMEAYNGELHILITESIKRHDRNGFERHKIVLHKQDFHRFVEKLQSTVDFIKDKQPDFDYSKYDDKVDSWDNPEAFPPKEPKEMQDKQEDITW